MPIERAADHPTFELGETRITSYAAPAHGLTRPPNWAKATA